MKNKNKKTHIKLYVDGKVYLDTDVEKFVFDQRRNNISCISTNYDNCIGIIPGSRNFCNISFVIRTPRKKQLGYIMDVFKNSLEEK